MTSVQIAVLVTVNAVAWFAVHMTFAWAGTRMPRQWFTPRRVGGREPARRGTLMVYERWLRIKAWKDLLPDGAAWFSGGFAKARLAHTDPDYLQAFVAETVRGETVHWAVMLVSGVFYILNPPGVGGWMIVYGVAANLPCILVQRYNRLRLQRMLGANRKCNGEQGSSSDPLG